MPQVQPKSQSGESSKKFLEFVMMQAQQIYFMLGLIPSPMTGRAEVNLKGARVYLEFLAVIKEKTRGNLNKEENDSLNRILHDLQMAYAETAAAMGELDADLPNLVDESELGELEEEAEQEPQPRATAEPARQPENKPAEKSAVVQESSGSKKKFVKSYGP